MIGIDTNILVRHITQDDELQSEMASKLIESYANKNDSLFINNIVFCELIWVLERGYKYSRKEVLDVMKVILTSIEFCFEDHRTLWMCIIDAEKTSADFSDILIGKLNELNDCSMSYTFDTKASTLSSFTKLV